MIRALIRARVLLLALVVGFGCIWYAIQLPTFPPPEFTPPPPNAAQIMRDAEHRAGPPSADDPETEPETVPNNSTTISGIVINQQGERIANADVAVYHPDRGDKKSTSDAQGRFTIDELETDKTYRVSANAPRYDEAVIENVSPGTSNIELSLAAACKALGTVVDAATRAPLADFEVAYLPYVPDKTSWAMHSLESSIAWRRVRDGNGNFELTSIRSGLPFAIAARAASHSAAYVTCDALAPGATADALVIALSAGATISGTVKDGDGIAVSGATVLIGTSDRSAVQSAQSSADGSFRIDGLSPASFIVIARHADHGEARAEGNTSEGREAKIELRFPKGGAIEGVVTNFGTPSEHARVLAAVKDTGSYRQAWTDEAGKFSIVSLPAGIYDVFAVLPNDDGGLESEKQITAAAEVETGKITFVTLAFQPATASVILRVTKNGTPLTDAEVRGVIGTDGGDKNFRATADEDGVYRAERLPPGAAYVEVIANQPSGPLKRALTFTLRDGEIAQHTVDFDVQIGITGRITTLAEGEHAEVMVVAGKADADLSKAEELIAVRHMASGVVEVKEDGTFSIEGLEPGDYTVIAVAFNPDDDAGNPLDSMRLTKEAVTLANESLELDLAP